jgi:5-methyltetrahydropteroyltriglutamate--homocysteine methyltransferase
MLTGIYPRSEALVAATRDSDRGRISREELEQHFERDYAQLIALQREAGFDLISDGPLNRQDLFRPFAEIIEHWDPGPLVRYFDNNTFCRQPRITGVLKMDASKLDDWLRRYFRTHLNETAPWKATLPSPCFTAHAAHDEHYHNRESLMLAYAEDVLAPNELYLEPNADLEFLPEAIARRKVNVLGEPTRKLAGEGAT